MNDQPKVLIIDNDADVHKVVREFLLKDGYQIESHYKGKVAIHAVRANPPDLILMEAVLPDVDGLMLCQQLRKMTEVPILFLSEKCEEIDKIVGLTAGADDYIAKPFGQGELIARIKAHIRRSYVHSTKIVEKASDILQIGSMVVDLERCTVEIDRNLVTLSSKEFKLLVFFAKHPGRVFQSEELYRKVWGYDGLDDLRTVAVHISTLRKKMEQHSSCRFIHNIRGLGYKFEAKVLEANLS